ncbi:tha4 hcf106 protein [Nannochloropsis oceanica]
MSFARRVSILALLVLLFGACADAFLPSITRPASTTTARRLQPHTPSSASSLLVTRPQSSPLSSLQQRSRGQPLYGIFGLGTPELVVIALVAGIVLGPDKIVDLARGVGKAAGELKAVPQEFEKGLKTGEEAAVKTKADLARESKEKESAKKE